MTDAPSRADGISIACVFNDPDVRRECLDRSVAAYEGPLDVEYVLVDNTAAVFGSAGAALNHAARTARHDVVVFVHQDVYLHSISRLAEVAVCFETDPSWGILGANGVTARGLSVGRMRDRAQLIGVPSESPTEVQTLDEVMFLVPRELVLAHPLSEDSSLSWHAYAVEYSLRMGRLGLRAGAVDLAITHNSMTANTSGLERAHGTIGALYPDRVPIRTTCGTVYAGRRRRHGDAAPRWRARWARRSMRALLAQRHVPLPAFLIDVRIGIDHLPSGSGRPLRLVNLDPTRVFAAHAAEVLRLTRRSRPVESSTVTDVRSLESLLQGVAHDQAVLLVDLAIDDLKQLDEVVADGRHWLLGVQDESYWLLGGIPAEQLGTWWSRREVVPPSLGWPLGRTA